MPASEEEIKISYANALKKAKTRQEGSCCGPATATCCPPSEEIIDSAPVVDQSISFGCLRLEDIIPLHVKHGMVGIDFGSGPGHDLMLLARAVGPEGRAIGVDMTRDMIVEAESVAEERGLKNVELVKANIEKIPLPDEIADIIISNCVINLASNKENVFKEAYRLLKPGGVLLDADVIAGRPLDENIRNNKELWCSCVGGALTEDRHRQLLEKIGFENISIEYGSKDQVTFDKQEVGIYSGLVSAKKPVN
ncbi:MAG: methyltransferase domain-containing protein [Candidatus Odinarchaeota archaeon]